MLIVGPNCVVSIHYKLTNDSGEVLDESQDEPLMYLHGAAGIIPGLEKELTGKIAGDRFQVTISPDDAYGEHQPHLVQKAPISAFSDPEKLQVGMQVTAQTEQGPITMTITDFDSQTVTVDGNHPLAGMTLHFEGSVVEVRAASAEELSHGHVHDGHSHH